MAQSGFQAAALALVHDLDAMREALDPVMVMAYTVRKKAAEQHLEALEAHGKVMSENEEEKFFEVPAEFISYVARLERRHQRAETATNILPRTFLVSFVSSFDAFVGRLIGTLFDCHPELLDKSERQLSYKQLLEFDSIETARKRLLEAEVESVMRESHAEQFKWLENKFKIKLRVDLASWPTFIELTERRNLFVHTHGKVSTQYLSVCKEHGCAAGSLSVDEVLDAEKSYLVEAYKCLYEIGIKLSQVFWRKMKPAELEMADQALLYFSYDLLVDEKFDIATRLLEFAVRLPKTSSENIRLMFVMNLAQAYKFSGREKESSDTLDREDWSACRDDFALCLAVMKDNFDKAAELMKSMGPAGAVPELSYINWPIFRKFRESEQFKTTFKEVFGHEPTSLLKLDTAKPDDSGSKSQGAAVVSAVTGEGIGVAPTTSPSEEGVKK